MFDQNSELSYQNLKKKFNNFESDQITNVDSFSIKDGLRGFKINNLAVKSLKYMSKFDIEVVSYERDRAIKIIDNSFRILYYDLQPLMAHELFDYVVLNSSNIKDIFQKPYENYDDLALFVIKNFVTNLKMDEYFNLDELDDENLFYEIA